MDPDAALTELRDLTREPDTHDEHQMSRTVELITALDQWLSAGGFLPAAWTR